MMKVTFGRIGNCVIALVSYEDGEPPRAYTISEMRDWLNEPLEQEIGTERFNKGTILNLALERFETEWHQPS